MNERQFVRMLILYASATLFALFVSALVGTVGCR